MGALLSGFLVVLVLGFVVAVASVLVVLTFVTTRALVRGGRRQRWVAAGLAVTLLTLAAYLAMGMGGVSAYPDTRCADHAPAGVRSWTQGAGLWPPGLQCRFDSTAGMTTYEEGFDLVWIAVAMTAVFAATMALMVVTVRYREGTVHFRS